MRLHVLDVLQTGMQCALSPDQAHYLTVVMRLKLGDSLFVFNNGGEWSANITHVSKKHLIVTVGSCVRPFQPCPEVWLAFSPLKHDAMTFLLEKATELGVTNFQPLIAARTNTHRLNESRMHKQVAEAAQQCERMCIPKIHPVRPLGEFLKLAVQHVQWFCAMEREDGPAFSRQAGPVGFVVGPEGGWTLKELQVLNATPYINRVSLGPRILRAETACLALLAKQL